MTEQKAAWVPVLALYESDSEIMVSVGIVLPAESSLIGADLFLPRAECRYHHGQWWVPAALLERALNTLLQRWRAPIRAVELYWAQLPVRDGRVDISSLLTEEE